MLLFNSSKGKDLEHASSMSSYAAHIEENPESHHPFIAATDLWIKMHNETGRLRPNTSDELRNCIRVLLRTRGEQQKHKIAVGNGASSIVVEHGSHAEHSS